MSNSIPMTPFNSGLELIRTTNPKVISQVWRNNFSAFGGDMSLDTWFEKSALRTSLDLGPGVEHRIWILVPKGKEDDPSSILSAVHTYERAGMMSSVVSDPNQDNGLSPPEISVQDIIVVYVLLVFTPPEHRRQGYGRLMLSMLSAQLKQQVDPAVTLSFLFSSAGPTFYESTGWPTIRSRELVLDVQGFDFPKLCSSRFPDTRYDIQDITEANFSEIINDDVKVIRQDLIKAQRYSLNQNERFALILPESRVFQGQIVMTKFENTKVARLNRPMTRIGARLYCKDEPETGYPFIIWKYLVTSKLLLIQRIRYENVGQLQRLLKEAMEEAANWDMTTIGIWDLDDQDAIEAAGMSNRDRKVAWSCLNKISESIATKTIRLLQNEAFIWGL